MGEKCDKSRGGAEEAELGRDSNVAPPPRRCVRKSVRMEEKRENRIKRRRKRRKKTKSVGWARH